MSNGGAETDTDVVANVELGVVIVVAVGTIVIRSRFSADEFVSADVVWLWEVEVEFRDAAAVC